MIPLPENSRDLLDALPHARSYVQYSRPDATDRLGVDFDAAGRLTVTAPRKAGRTPRIRFLSVWPARLP